MTRMSQAAWARVAWTALAVYGAALFLGTHLPNFATGPARYNDKAAHFLGYFILAFLAAWAWSMRRRLTTRAMLLMAAAISAYGAVDEWTQRFVPGRSADVRDWLADTLGTVAGLLAFRLLCACVRPFGRAARH
ncbi:MAG: hypothetical protein FJ276_05545 [Planctomycetes bacterium]|nr:hypothetical protein [Planctomycetota bacterium]